MLPHHKAFVKVMVIKVLLLIGIISAAFTLAKFFRV